MADDAITINTPVVKKTSAGVMQDPSIRRAKIDVVAAGVSAKNTLVPRTQEFEKINKERNFNFTKEQKDILLNDPQINGALCKHDWSALERRIKELAFWQKEVKDNALKVLKSFWDSNTHKEMQSEFRKEKFALLVLEYVRTSNRNRDDPALKEMERWIRESTRQMTSSEIKEAGRNIVASAAKEKLDISCLANLGIKELNASILDTLDMIAGGGKIASSLTQGMGIDMMITGDAARMMREAFSSAIEKNEAREEKGGEEAEDSGKKKLELVPKKK